MALTKTRREHILVFGSFTYRQVVVQAERARAIVTRQPVVDGGVVSVLVFFAPDETAQRQFGVGVCVRVVGGCLWGVEGDDGAVLETDAFAEGGGWLAGVGCGG